MRTLLLASVAILFLSACAKKDAVLLEAPSTERPPITTPIPAESTPLNTPGQPLDIESTTTDGERIVVQSGKSVDLAQFGLKPYPSTLPTDDNQTTFTNTDEKSDANLTFFTKDKPSEVADFYAPQIASNKSKSVTKTNAVVGGITSNGSEVFIVASEIGNRTQISITATRKK